MLDNIRVGSKIAYLRKQNGLTQEELAEKLGITAQAISKWENGHTLPETVLLPTLSQLFDCTIDSILMPLAAQDSAFLDFAHAVGGESGELALLLYQRIKENLDFTISYKDKYYIFEEAFSGASAIFNNPDKDDFIIRMDVIPQATGGGIVNAKLTLPNCSNYMNIIEGMPEHIKQCFRCSDCRSCQCNKCPYVMVYTFEGIDYKQCHFIGINLDSKENMEHIWTLLYAEHVLILIPIKKADKIERAVL